MLIRIDDPDNCAIGRRVFTLERKAGFLSPAPEDQFSDPGAGGIYGHQWFALRQEILIKRLDDQQLATVQRRILHGCDDGADYAGELHISFRALEPKPSECRLWPPARIDPAPD